MNDYTTQECIARFTRMTEEIDAALAEWRKDPNDQERERELLHICTTTSPVRAAGESLWGVVEIYRRKWHEAIGLVHGHRAKRQHPSLLED